MATQTDLDRLLIAWARLQAAVNAQIPDYAARLRAVRTRLQSAASRPSRML